jgi:hypothetical protein
MAPRRRRLPGIARVVRPRRYIRGRGLLIPPADLPDGPGRSRTRECTPHPRARPGADDGPSGAADQSLVIGTGRALQLAVLFLDISGFSDRPSGDAHEQHNVLQVSMIV